MSQAEPVDLFEQIPLYNSEPLLRHEAKRAIPDRLIECELAGDDFVDVLAERVVVPLRDLHGTEHFVLARLIGLQLLEGLAGVFYSAEVFVDPDDQISIRRAFGEAPEALQAVEKSLTTGDDGVHIQCLCA